ncbi:3-phosphoshikimate 1-carboxyvinyltransferase [Virgibacillus phasianinus]|uniref:3-phosphoshikimate 1-carboxyvinyltransferase n=1 Tax=Virgibacillus phasianinus TaxID=2017483 RepID=A0A220U5T7_9BACI|nr:3-phosphoshikimate 1-carboxyvinyltransferase [Virgibacillus phasianinus]ASK63342.1 3-phosphoshikimate 1-carboxyvinyltransferase [Virgibacillus phasianinus]
MAEKILTPNNHIISGVIEVPGDKSISHRAIIMGSIANGTTEVSNFLNGEDCMRTIDVFESMGVKFEKNGTNITIHGKGIKSLKKPAEELYFGNSGTTARLLLGVLAGLPFQTTVAGDESLSKRPMNRVILPLREMGARINGKDGSEVLPLRIEHGQLTGIQYKLPVKSAQVKSAILLAGLYAANSTEVIEPTPTRDHTEHMLKAFGADIERNGLSTKISGDNSLYATNVTVPGDISSAAFLLTGAAIVPNSRLTIRRVGLNETRTGIIDVLIEMGSAIEITNSSIVNGELIGDVTITYTKLRGINIEGEIIPRLIDEIPIIALLATQAEGTTIIKDAEELRYKETDRIHAVTDVLTKLGAAIEGTADGMIIHGKTPLSGGEVSGYHDHRIAMMASIASLITTGEVVLDDDSSINISYPGFFQHLDQVQN